MYKRLQHLLTPGHDESLSSNFSKRLTFKTERHDEGIGRYFEGEE